MIIKSINLTQLHNQGQKIGSIKETTKDCLVPISLNFAFYRSILGDVS
jgi:hypothetical protein